MKFDIFLLLTSSPPDTHTKNRRMSNGSLLNKQQTLMFEIVKLFRFYSEKIRIDAEKRSNLTTS